MSFRSSTWRTDVVIPCIEKNISTLELAIRGVRKYLQHPIGQIYLVCPPSPAIAEVAVKENCEVYSERDLVGFSPADIRYFPGGVDRRGWLYQQFIKLASDKLGNSPYCLVLDSDTVMIRPQSFERAGKIVVQYSDEQHLPYREFISDLKLGWKLFGKSFVCHHFFFKKEHLSAVRKLVENSTGTTWNKGLEALLKKDELSGFSEYELLGNYYYNERRDQIYLQHCRNSGVSEQVYKRAALPKRLFWYLKFQTVSMHNYEPVEKFPMDYT